jgi:hypothetical protein
MRECEGDEYEFLEDVCMLLAAGLTLSTAVNIILLICGLALLFLC